MYLLLQLCILLFFREWFIHSVIAKTIKDCLFDDRFDGLIFTKNLPTLPVIKINYKVYTCYYEYVYSYFLESGLYTQ